jgi:hypothetical protein
MNREIKFRVWNKATEKMKDWDFICKYSNLSKLLSLKHNVVMQFTGLKDKNTPCKNCVYEGDVLSLEGIVIGNIYENKEMAENKFNIVIQNIGTREWRNSEKEAMDRGCSYS